MARVDYFALEQEIQRVLNSDGALGGTQVAVEDEFPFAAEATPWVGIYLERRDAPADLQRLAAGQQTRFLVRFSIRCWQYSLQSIAAALQLRDDLVGKVEIALMGNRTLNGKVEKSWLEGGEFLRPPAGSDWMAGGEVVLVADVKASTA